MSRKQVNPTLQREGIYCIARRIAHERHLEAISRIKRQRREFESSLAIAGRIKRSAVRKRFRAGDGQKALLFMEELT